METNITKFEAGQEQQISLLVQRKETATARNNSVYEKLYVRDKEGHQVCVYNWNEPFAPDIPVVICARIQTEAFNSSLSYRMQSYQADNTSKQEEFLPKPEIDVKASWHELITIAKTLPEPLLFLVKKVLMPEQKKFLNLPLTSSRSFSRRCGILEATLRLTKMTQVNVEILGLDQNVAVTAAILYYTGHLDCIDDAFLSTEDDVLIGNGTAAYEKMMRQVYAIRNSTEENVKKLAENLDELEIKLISHTLLSRKAGISTAIPEAVLLRNEDVILRDADLMQRETASTSPGSTKIVSGIGKVFSR